MEIWCDLCGDMDLIPSPEMSNEDRLNCLTRIVILASFILYIILPSANDWLVFLGLSLLSILFIWKMYPYFSVRSETPKDNINVKN